MKRSQKLPAFTGIYPMRRAVEAARYDAARAVLLANQRRAQRSSRADSILLLLLALLALGGLSHCTTAKPTAPAEAHATTAEHATPTNIRGWHEVDTTQE